MKLEIVQRRFAKLPEGGWIELEDLMLWQPGTPKPRTWTGYCVFFSDLDPTGLRDKFDDQRIDVVASVKPYGTWMMGGHWSLTLALREMTGQAYP